MLYNGLNQRQRNEMTIYRLLGVDYFRKAILWHEKVKKRKHNRINENYHPLAMNVISLEKYDGFLLYNTILHCVSMFFVIIYYFLSLTCGLQNWIIDIFLTIISIFNLYCIILQRTNYLRIRGYSNKYYRHLQNKISPSNIEVMRQIYVNTPELLYSDYKVICRLKNALDGKMDCYISLADVENLKRIVKCVESLPQKNSNRKFGAVSEAGVLELCNSTKGPYTLLQRRTDYLQRILRVSGRKMLDQTAVITENAECELLYRKLVLEDTVSNYCLVIWSLYEMFSEEIKKGKVNELSLEERTAYSDFLHKTGVHSSDIK